MKIDIHNWGEIITLIVCTVCRFRHKTWISNNFLWFLALTVILEFTGKYLKYHSIPNAFLYNIFTCFEFLFYGWFCRRLMSEQINKIRITILFIPYLIFCIINIAVIQGLRTFNTYSYDFGIIVLVCCCCLLYWDLLNNSSAIRKTKNKVVFLTLAGLLLFYAGQFALMLFLNNLIESDKKQASFLFKIINQYLNIVLYGSFSLAFIVEQKSLTCISRTSVN